MMDFRLEINNGKCKINGKPLEEYSKEEQAEFNKEIKIINSVKGNSNLVLNKSVLGNNRTFTFPDELTKKYAFDRLEQIFREQEIFTNRIYKKFEDRDFSCYNFEKETFDLYYTIVRLIQEAFEALHEIDNHTKIWKNNKGESYDKEKVFTELVDASKFLHQAIIFLGKNADDYYLKHTKKNEENHKRQDNGY